MSYYPPPKNESNIFNAIDYGTTPEEIEEHNDSNDLTLLVHKTGDTMSGVLTVPQITFTGDSSHQTTAFTTAINNNIEANKAKLVNITSLSDVVTINKLVTDQITLTNTNGDQILTALDKVQINANKGNIQTNTNKLVNVTASDLNNITIKDAEVICNNGPDYTTVNPLPGLHYDRFRPTFTSQANYDVLGTNKDTVKYSWGIVSDDSKIETSRFCLVADDDVVFTIRNDGEFDLKAGIEFSDNTTQNTAFTDIMNTQLETNTTQIETNKTDISDIQVKTDTIEEVTATEIYTKHRLSFRNQSNENMGYIGTNGNGMSIGCTGDLPLVINPDSGHIQHYCQKTFFGDNNGSGKLILNNSTEGDPNSISVA